MSDEEGYLSCTLNNKEVKMSYGSNRSRPILTVVWRVLLIPVFVSPDFTIGCMVCLHSFLFTVMEGKEYFMV